MPTHPMAALINISLELEMPTPSADTFSNTADLAAIASNLPFVFLWNAAVVVRCKIGVAILAPLTGIAVALPNRNRKEYRTHIPTLGANPADDHFRAACCDLS